MIKMYHFSQNNYIHCHCKPSSEFCCELPSDKQSKSLIPGQTEASYALQIALILENVGRR